MKIKIERTEKSTQEIEKVLEKANGKAKERLLNVEDVVSLAEFCENKLNGAGIPRKMLMGTVAFTDGGQIGGKSYKYKYGSTAVAIKRGGKDWFLIRANRTEYYPGSVDDDSMMLTDAAAEWYQKNKLKDFQKIS
jgi:hypothetical protein